MASELDKKWYEFQSARIESLVTGAVARASIQYGWDVVETATQANQLRLVLGVLEPGQLTDTQIDQLNGLAAFIGVEPYKLGKGGASSIEIAPFVDPELDPARYEDNDTHVVDVPVEASTSQDVGLPIVDVPNALHRIHDPEVKDEWWPPAQPDPNPPPVPPSSGTIPAWASVPESD